MSAFTNNMSYLTSTLFSSKQYCLKILFFVLNNLLTKDYFSKIRIDIVDIKPANMEELTEVITAAEFHPKECNLFVYSSSKGIIRLCDMRQSALCDNQAKSRI